MAAALTALDPIPQIMLGSVDLQAVEAGRSPDGLIATILAINGTLKASDLVKLGTADNRLRFAEANADTLGLPVDDIRSALLNLHPAVEAALRQPSPRGRGAATPPRPTRPVPGSGARTS